jgi:hypothetical protein
MIFSNSIITLNLPFNRDYKKWFEILTGQFYIFEKEDNIF